MPLSITLRRGPDISPFRRQLLRLVQAPVGDSVILCYGYIYDYHLPTGYSVSRDALCDALVAGCAGGHVEVLGGMFSHGYWRQHFAQFVNQLRHRGLDARAFIAGTQRWHAKIAIRLDGEAPIAAIIGSSNLTGPAYREDPRQRWNYECDLTLWQNHDDLNDHFRSSPQGVDDLGFIASILDPEASQLDERARLRRILAELRSATDGFEPFGQTE